MSGHAILLAGAPEANNLNWDGNLLDSFGTPVRRFLGAEMENQAGTPAPTFTAPKWRSLPMTSPAHDATVPEPENAPQTQFLAHEVRDYEAESQERLRFLEHSLALLNELDSSQIAAPEDVTTLPSTYSCATEATMSTSFGSITGSFGFSATSPDKLGNGLASLQLRGDITDIRRIPPVDHITRIAPQTMTVNLIAAIISVSPSRMVRLRKRAAEMELLEVLLGDDTTAGFGVTFWLSPSDSQGKHRDDEMRKMLLGLRAGDVVVAQNVALSAFKGQVYGQSLSRRFARNSTAMTPVKAEEAKGLPGLVRGKFERVERWADEFVGRAPRTAVAIDGVDEERVRQDLPPDTQSPTKYY